MWGDSNSQILFINNNKKGNLKKLNNQFLRTWIRMNNCTSIFSNTRELFLCETRIFRLLMPLFWENTCKIFGAAAPAAQRTLCYFTHTLTHTHTHTHTQTHAPHHIHDHPSHSNTQHFTGWPAAHLWKLRLSIDFVSSPNSFMKHTCQ